MRAWGIGLVLVVTAAALLGLVLETTVFQVARVSSVIPDLVLILGVYLGLHRHTVAGSAGAFLLGYLNDSFAGNVIGLHAFAMTLVFVVVYLISRRVWTENVLANAAIVFVAAILKGATVAVLLALFLSNEFPWPLFASSLWLDALIAALVSPVVFTVLDGARQLWGMD